MGKSRSRLAADWFAKLRVNAITQEVEHEDVVAEQEALDAAEARIASDVVAAKALADSEMATVQNSSLAKTGGAMTGAITTNSTFDGRDVSVDGSKLDGIEAGATADQTKADIDALGITAANLTSGAQIIAGTLTVGNTISSDIYMVDTDEGTRRIHCNSNRVGFLNSSNQWSAYSTDAGLWQCDSGLGVNGAITASGSVTANNVWGITQTTIGTIAYDAGVETKLYNVSGFPSGTYMFEVYWNVGYNSKTTGGATVYWSGRYSGTFSLESHPYMYNSAPSEQIPVAGCSHHRAPAVPTFWLNSDATLGNYGLTHIYIVVPETGRLEGVTVKIKRVM